MDPEIKQVIIQAQMSCEGCSSSIQRIVGQVNGVKSVECSIPEQKCVVLAEHSVSPEHLLEQLKPWAESAGKQISLSN